MNVVISPSSAFGTVRAIASKSVAHRALICAAFADTETKIRCEQLNKDIEATARCLEAIGAKISYSAPFFTVSPVKSAAEHAILYCGESGSTLRFLLPVVSALGLNASFVMEGRLPQRPLSPLYEELCAHGASLSPQGENPFISKGKLSATDFSIRGDISSQFISGLLFASVLMGGGIKINIIGETESSAYIDMTVQALSLFGVKVCKLEHGYEIPCDCKLVSPHSLDVEGDWSNAAFPLCMGAIGGSVEVTGLNPESLQGDKKIIDVLQEFGATVKYSNGAYTVSSDRELCGIELDASEIPDLVPVIATVATVAKGETRIIGAARLRIKESDRLDAITKALTALGADIKETEDGLVICGKPSLRGGQVDSFNDHRIAMSAAVASVVCNSEVTVNGAQCVEKSYPAFWNDACSLGLKITK